MGLAARTMARMFCVLARIVRDITFAALLWPLPLASARAPAPARLTGAMILDAIHHEDVQILGTRTPGPCCRGR